MAPGHILGNKPKLRMSDWKWDGAETELFPLKRGEPWDHDKPGDAEPVERNRPTPGTGEVPAELRDVERMTHRDRRVLSLINVELWNKAKWTGTGYITSENPVELPFLLLMFDNPEAAVDIFTGWRDLLGPEDAKEQLRVSIVTGVERKNPSAYRVVVSSNVDSSTMESWKQVLIVGQINASYPESSENVDRFLENYQRKKRYILAPAQPGPDGIQGWALKLGVSKREINVRPAWEIGEHDPDRIAVRAEDDVIIPEGVTNAPVLGVLKDKRKREEEVQDTRESQRKANKVGRNDPCPCGSGRKYKKCHGK